MYHVRLLEAASKNLAKLERPLVRRIIDRLQWLEENVREADLEALVGEFKGMYKLRVGDHRVIYELLHGERLIIVHMIGHRREVYRRR